MEMKEYKKLMKLLRKDLKLSNRLTDEDVIDIFINQENKRIEYLTSELKYNTFARTLNQMNGFE